MKLGDAVATIVQPIAHGVDSVFETNIASCGGCKRRQHKLNDLGDSIYDFLWDQLKKEQENAVHSSKKSTDNNGSTNC